MANAHIFECAAMAAITNGRAVTLTYGNKVLLLRLIAAFMVAMSLHESVKEFLDKYDKTHSGEIPNSS